MEPLELRITRTRRSYRWPLLTHIGLIVMAVAVVVVSGKPAMLTLAAPSLVVLLVAAITKPLVRPGVSASIDRPRALEGDTVTITVELASGNQMPVSDIEFYQNHREPLQVEGPTRALRSLGAASAATCEFRVTVDNWGLVQLGSLRVTARDHFGLISLATDYALITPIKVHIHEEVARSLTEPERFRRLVGSHQSSDRGEGCEIADVRAYQPGDRLQALNWRISARNDEPWITLRHPDRSTNIVLLLDAHERFGQRRAALLRRSIRATLGLARLHLGNQDPVGLMIVGRGMRWIPPKLGRLHLHQITDSLLELSTSEWPKATNTRSMIDRIPPDAVVLAVSPLVNNRFSQLVMALRARGQPIQVIQPVNFWPAYADDRRQGNVVDLRAPWRVFSLRAQLVRKGLSEAGVPVIPWEEDQPIESVMLALRMSSRARRSVVRT